MKWYKWILVLILLGWIIRACDSPECDLDGCERKGIGWTNDPPSSSLCKGIPCRPMGAKKGTGFCSREHANRAIWE